MWKETGALERLSHLPGITKSLAEAGAKLSLLTPGLVLLILAGSAPKPNLGKDPGLVLEDRASGFSVPLIPPSTLDSFHLTPELRREELGWRPDSGISCTGKISQST